MVLLSVFILSLLCLPALVKAQATSVELYAMFLQEGFRGSVGFSFSESQGRAIVRVDLSSELHSEASEYKWYIHALPIDLTKRVKCDRDTVGERLFDLTDRLGHVMLPVTKPVDLGLPNVNLTGVGSLWGRSLVLDGPSRLCASIMPLDGLEIAVARFLTPVSGSVVFYTWSPPFADGPDTMIISDLRPGLQNTAAASYRWRLYATDVLDSGVERSRQGCDALQILYDPDGRGQEQDCRGHQCAVGDLSARFGKMSVVGNSREPPRKLFSYPMFALPNLEGPRALHVVLLDESAQIWSCAPLHYAKARQATALMSRDGVVGEITMQQRYIYHPTRLLVNMTGLANQAGKLAVHEFPLRFQHRTSTNETCLEAGEAYKPGVGSPDVLPLDELDRKLRDVDSLTWLEYYPQLPLFGSHSILGRSLMLYFSNGSQWLCANIESESAVLAEANFNYPLSGRVSLTQWSEEDHETSIFIEGLLYSDGSTNASSNHQWFIHAGTIDKDYHDWQNRCRSAGPLYNPFRMALDGRHYDCNGDAHERCALGDLLGKHGVLSLAGRRTKVTETKRYFTDSNLPLTGPYSVIGKSVVVQDDNSPKQRGIRLACTMISRIFRHKAVVSDWFSNGNSNNRFVTGKFEFYQDTPYSSTRAVIGLKDLGSKLSGYHVHMVPVIPSLQFPCTDQVLYGHYNPLNITAALSPPPGQGTNSEYEVGDLSGKHGTLAEKDSYSEAYNDTYLPLFGPTSILGRSIVLHRKGDNERMFCASIGWGYSASEARQIRVMASFHHPLGFAWGYVRMSQLAYAGGGTSETTIEVNLRYPGENDRNLTYGHDWRVFVNAIGQDASVSSDTARCTAAGFVWNPSFVQLTAPRDDETYKAECGPEVPRRCMVGDISGRMGPITLGGKRLVFMDSNLPLSGPYSVLGRSLVIGGRNGSGDRFACANILEDHDTFKFVVIWKSPQFIPSNFIKDVRTVLGIPEWMLAVDSREMKEVQEGKCLQMRIVFFGPFVNQIEKDLGRLLSRIPIDEPSIYSPGALPNPKRPRLLSYRSCDDKENRRDNNRAPPTPSKPTSSGLSKQPGRLVAMISALLVTFYFI